VNWRDILRDKRLLAGVGVAAAVGLVVFLRRGGGGVVDGGDAEIGTGTATSSGVGYLGGYDSVSADVASQLGQYGAGLQSQLDEFAGTLNDALEAMADAQNPATPTPTQPSTPATPASPAAKKKAAAAKAKGATTKQYVTVKRWTKGKTPWQSTLSGIASHYKTTVTQLLRLNPGIKNKNLIYPGQKIRVK
jgi:LysM repeat protein